MSYARWTVWNDRELALEFSGLGKESYDAAAKILVDDVYGVSMQNAHKRSNHCWFNPSESNHSIIFFSPGWQYQAPWLLQLHESSGHPGPKLAAVLLWFELRAPLGVQGQVRPVELVWKPLANRSSRWELTAVCTVWYVIGLIQFLVCSTRSERRKNKLCQWMIATGRA